MQSGLVLAVTVFFLGVFAEEVSKAQVKKAFIHGLKSVHENPKYVEGYEKHWDGSMPETLADMKTLLLNVGVPEQEVQKVVDRLAEVTNNKDNPSWKTIYGNLFVELGGADRSLVEAMEKHAGDHIPKDIEEAKQVLAKMGVSEEHLLGQAKVMVWLGQTRA